MNLYQKEIKISDLVTIPIWPSTNVRSTQGDRWLFSVSDEYLQEYDAKKLKETGIAGRNLNRKRQLEKYNDYKEELQTWASKNSFTMPDGYFCIRFYIPFPASWRKKKRAEMHYNHHASTPDLDNLIKALFDGLMPRRNRIDGSRGADDRRIHCYAAFKFWVPFGEERIEIIKYSKESFSGFFLES